MAPATAIIEPADAERRQITREAEKIGAERRETLGGHRTIVREWIALDSARLAAARRQLARHLPYSEADECLAELLLAELAAAAEAGRAGLVRAERLTPTWLRLESRKWRERREAPRLADLGQSASGDDELADVGADDDDGADDGAAVRRELAAESRDIGAELDDDDDDDAERAAWRAYRAAVELAESLYLDITRPLIVHLADGWSDHPARVLADGWGMSLATWKREKTTGAAELELSYPEADRVTRVAPKLRAMLSADRAVSRRATALDARKIGAAPPECEQDRHRTAAQLAREADWLIARDQLPGRAPSASPASSTDWRAPKAAPTWRRTWRAELPELFDVCRRAVVAALTPPGATSGPRAHRAAAGLPGGGIGAYSAPELAAAEWSGMFTYVGAGCGAGLHPSWPRGCATRAGIPAAEIVTRSPRYSGTATAPPPRYSGATSAPRVPRAVVERELAEQRPDRILTAAQLRRAVRTGHRYGWHVQCSLDIGRSPDEIDAERDDDGAELAAELS